MNICDHKHPLIAHGERNCPLCELLDTIDTHLHTITTHEKSLEKCEDKIYDLSTELERLASTYEPESLL
jgi:hypothetical protein